MLNQILIIGVITSLLFYEITEISPGGIIAPAYFALYMDSPIRIFTGIFLSIITYFVVKLLSNYTILYGHRKFTVYVIVAILIKIVLDRLGIILIDYNVIFASGAIGMVIPAIIARDIEKQGSLKTISSLLIVSIFVKTVVEIL